MTTYNISDFTLWFANGYYPQYIITSVLLKPDLIEGMDYRIANISAMQATCQQVVESPDVATTIPVRMRIVGAPLWGTSDADAGRELVDLNPLAIGGDVDNWLTWELEHQPEPNPMFAFITQVGIQHPRTLFGKENTHYSVAVTNCSVTCDMWPMAINTLPATDIKWDRATLRGNFASNGNGLEMSCGFELGLDTGYGQTFSLGVRGLGAYTKTLDLGALNPLTAYHYRAYAIYGSGDYGSGGAKIYGEDKTFTTIAVPPPSRGYYLPEIPDTELKTLGIITLQALRNLEMTTMGRFYIDKQGNARFESRYARNP